MGFDRGIGHVISGVRAVACIRHMAGVNIVSRHLVGVHIVQIANPIGRLGNGSTQENYRRRSSGLI